MMKLGLNILFRLFLIVLVVTPYFIMPKEVNAAADTLRDLKDELAALESQKDSNDSSVKSTESQINNNKQDIQEAYDNIKQSETDIEIAKKSIEESDKKINELADTVGDLIVLFEQISSQETYIDYITGGASMTEIIMREDAIQKIIDYNKSQITEFENLITDNEQKQLDLINYQDDLEGNIVTYEAKVDSLEGELSYYAEITEDIEDQIKNQRALIEYYEDIGCKLDQSLTDCVSIANNRGWVKPLVTAMVTSPWGMRSGTLHNGIDLGRISEGTNVYAAAAGTVAAITRKSSCGGNKVYVHVYVNGVAYTNTYLHLLEIKVDVGDKVTTDTIVGTVGGGSGTQWYDNCTTGTHLHFGISKGFYLGGGPDGYSSYSQLVSRSIDPPGFPDKYGWFYSRTQWFD